MHDVDGSEMGYLDDCAMDGTHTWFCFTNLLLFTPKNQDFGLQLECLYQIDEK